MIKWKDFPLTSADPLRAVGAMNAWIETQVQPIRVINVETLVEVLGGGGQTSTRPATLRMWFEVTEPL